MLIRQAAFIDAKGPLLKGGLHCHTTRSDGTTTPEETIRQHAAAGYDFLTLTDHRVYNFADYAPDSGVLIMPGTELDANITTRAGMCFHTVAIGPDEPENGYHQDERFSIAPVADQGEFQSVLDGIRAHGNLAMYCHPQWSYTPARSFDQIEGFFAMELWNTGCVQENRLDVDNGFIWDEILMQGKRIFGTAVDDGHGSGHHCRGWVRVNAEKTRASIFSALKEGAFYSSCGPEIYDFYVEDCVAHIKCSPCANVQFLGGCRPTRLLTDPDGPITQAKMLVHPSFFYVRAVVTDSEGRMAWTNPIFLG